MMWLLILIYISLLLLAYSIGAKDRVWIFATSVALIVLTITLIITTKR